MTMKTRNKTYGKREIMLVAHQIAKQFKLTMSEALKDAWRWFKSNSSNFTYYLSIVIKNKRKAILNSVDFKNIAMSQPTQTAVTYNFHGQVFDMKYNCLYR